MTVRGALLALLTLGPGYGHQLTAELARRTGEAINPGQTHATLERLRRDGLVVELPRDADGLVRLELTDAGREAAAAWLVGGADGAATRDDLAVRIALVASLPGEGAGPVIAAARSALARRREALLAGGPAGERTHAPAALDSAAAALLADRELARLDADLAWLDRAEALAARIEPSRLGEPPPRGRRRRG